MSPIYHIYFYFKEKNKTDFSKSTFKSNLDKGILENMVKTKEDPFGNFCLVVLFENSKNKSEN